MNNSQEKNNNNLENLTENYNEFLDQIFRFIYFRTNNKEIAEDLTQDCFLSVIKYIKENHVDNLRAFLYKIAKNKLIDYYRKKNRVFYTSETIEEKYEPISNDDILEKQDIKIIIEKLQLLNEEDRDILIMRYLEDLEIKNIAEIIGKSQITTRVKIFRALRKAKKLM